MKATIRKSMLQVTAKGSRIHVLKINIHMKHVDSSVNSIVIVSRKHLRRKLPHEWHPKAHIMALLQKNDVLSFVRKHRCLKNSTFHANFDSNRRHLDHHG
jgi:hypothetical protein